MSTLKVNTIQNTSGGSSSTPDQIANGRAKVWANIDGVDTVGINDSFNVSSVTDEGTGQYRVNFSITMANTNFAAVNGGASRNTTGSYDTFITTNDFTTTSLYLMSAIPSGRYDADPAIIAVFGDV